jgi:hypothetical protein
MSEPMTSADEGVERVGLALGAALAPVGPPVHLDNPHTLLGEVAGQPGTVGTSVHPDRRRIVPVERSRSPSGDSELERVRESHRAS